MGRARAGETTRSDQGASGSGPSPPRLCTAPFCPGQELTGRSRKRGSQGPAIGVHPTVRNPLPTFLLSTRGSKPGLCTVSPSSRSDLQGTERLGLRGPVQWFQLSAALELWRVRRGVVCSGAGAPQLPLRSRLLAVLGEKQPVTRSWVSARGNSTETPQPSLRHMLCPGEKSTRQA